MKSYVQRAGEVVASKRFAYVATGLAIVLTLPSLGIGFLADDYMQRAVFLQPEGLSGMIGDDPFSDFFTFADGDPARMERFRDLGIYPWFAQDDARMSLWRPLTVVTHWIDYTLWPGSALLMHVHSLLWFGAVVLSVGFFYRRMMGPGIVSGLAILLFAIDDAHAWPAAWIANRNALVALPLGVLALGMHDRWRREGQVWAAFVAAPLLLLALLAKESSVSVCGYLFAYAVFVDPGGVRSRALSLVPYAAVAVAWRVAYVAGGYGASGGGYIDPLGAPLRFAGAVLARGPVLLQGQWGFVPSDFYSLGPPSWRVALVASGVLVAGVLGVLLAPLLRRDAMARFWCLGMLLSIVPVCAAGPQDRLLMFPGVGAMALLARYLVAVRSGNFRSRARALLWLQRPAYFALVGVHLFLAPLLLPLGILAFSFLGGNMTRIIAEDLPSDAAVAEQTFIFANGASYPVATYLYIVRGLEGETVPAHVRSFAPGTMTAVPLRLTRTGERTVVVVPEGGYPAALFRDRPLWEGEIVELSGMKVEILRLGDDGWPSDVAYHFEKSLDDPSLRWFRVEGLGYVPMEPPGVGETLRIGPFGMATVRD